MFALLSVAFAAEQHLVYDLSVNGAPVGTREVTVRYLPREGGERRVIEAYTTLTVGETALVCRTSGSSGPRGATFTSAVDANGNLSEVQGVSLPGGGWRLTVTDAKGTRETKLTRDDAQLSSLDLLDPTRNRVLQVPGNVGIVLVETGDVVRGAVAEGAEGQAKIAGTKVPVTRYAVDGLGGRATFDLDGDGLLLRSELAWIGSVVVATVHAIPEARSWGTIEAVEEAGVEAEAL